MNLLFNKSHANFLNIFHCIFSVGVIFIWVCWTNVLVNTVPFLYIVKVLHVNKNRTVICSRWDKIGHNFCYLATFTMYIQQGYSVYKYICSAYSNEIDTNWKYATKNVQKIGARLVFIGIDFTFSMTESRIFQKKRQYKLDAETIL